MQEDLENNVSETANEPTLDATPETTADATAETVETGTVEDGGQEGTAEAAPETPAAEAVAAPEAASSNEDGEDAGLVPHRKVRVGVVVSDKMNKSIVVRVTRHVRHPLYKKYFFKSKKFMVHDESNECHVGDTVRIVETRPLSAQKRWRLDAIVERAK